MCTQGVWHSVDASPCCGLCDRNGTFVLLGWFTIERSVSPNSLILANVRVGSTLHFRIGPKFEEIIELGNLKLMRTATLDIQSACKSLASEFRREILICFFQMGPFGRPSELQDLYGGPH